MKAYLKDMLDRIKADALKAHKSMTAVVNALSAALASVWLYLMSNPEALHQAMELLPQLADLLSPKVLTVLTLGMNLLNIALRFKTDGRMANK